MGESAEIEFRVRILKRMTKRGPMTFETPEIRCPLCKRWTGLLPEILDGRDQFICPNMVRGCGFKTKPFDFRPWVADAKKAEAQKMRLRPSLVRTSIPRPTL